MTSSNPKGIISPEFQRNIKRATGNIGDSDLKEEFKVLIQEVINQIIDNPLQVISSGGVGVVEWCGPEGAPGFLNTQAGSRLFKAYLKVPGVRGAAGQGRIMYMVQESTLQVDFLMYYTHAEFGKRPNDRYLKGVFREARVPR